MNRLAATSFVLFAFSLATSPSPIVTAFSPQQFPKLNLISNTHLNYRSMHHGPDVQPLTEQEKLGASATKMDKDKIQRYGPGDFHQYTDDGSQDIFDGGDSEMGLSGDGSSGLKKIGRDVTPHMAKTLSSKTDQEVSSRIVSYTDELLESNPHMDIVRAQQLESWATQQEIARTNRYMDTRGDLQQGRHLREYYQPCENENENESAFDRLTQPGDEVEGIVSLRAPVNSVAAHEFAIKSPYMGWAKFRAGFIGDDSNQWSVSANDSFLKSHEETNFVLRYTPHRPGVSNAYFVIETEDFTKTWKVVGSTGEYAFSNY